MARIRPGMPAPLPRSAIRTFMPCGRSGKQLQGIRYVAGPDIIAASKAR